MTGAELESLQARLAGTLYLYAEPRTKGFEFATLATNSYDIRELELAGMLCFVLSV